MDPTRASRVLLVFEKRPRWTPELERRFLDDPVHVRGCHSAADAPALAAREGAALVVLSLENAEGECLQILGRLAADAPRVPVIALAAEESAGLEWSFREVGALDFLAGRFTAPDVARVCRRQLFPEVELSMQVRAGGLVVIGPIP